MTKAFRVLSKVSITRMRLASQTREPRGALYLFAERRCAGIVQRCTPDTCCLGRALGKTRCLLGERTQRKRASERVVTTRINYDRPFAACVHPFYERGAPDSSTSLLTDLPLRYPRIISPLFALFAIFAILREYFPRLRSRKGRRHAIIYNANDRERSPWGWTQKVWNLQ